MPEYVKFPRNCKEIVSNSHLNNFNNLFIDYSSDFNLDNKKPAQDLIVQA